MYLYSFVISYIGAADFMILLWGRITRGTGQMPMQLQLTPAQAQALRAQATAEGFAFSNITRVPVASPEVIP